MDRHERLHALDAVRGGALLAGVMLHAAMSFLPGFAVTGLPIYDNSPSATLGVAFFVIHMGRMTLFFVIAGFFGRLLLHRDGMRGFLANRAKRIAVPLILGWLIVFPPIVAAIIWGAIKLGSAAPPPPPTPPEGGPLLPFPLTHLWFLYVLLWLYSLAAVVHTMLERWVDAGGRLRSGIDRVVGWLLHQAWSPWVLALPLAVTLAVTPGWIGWFGIPTPDYSLVPNLPATIAFATAFGLGWLVQRQTALLKVWTAQWATHLGLAIGLTGVCLWLAGVTPRYEPLPAGIQAAAYAVCYAAGLWHWTFAILGMALRYLGDNSPVRRYIADASYWVYLMHLPLVLLLQAAVMDLPWHWTVKFPLIVTVTLVLLFGSYHWMVRSTWIGLLLNGRRYPRRIVMEKVPTPVAVFADE
jgi:glucans biosynthesis protein C